MNVDEAGRRAGSELRDRFDATPTPGVDELQPVTQTRSGRRGALIGIAVVLVIALIIALIGPWRDEAPPAGPGGSWRRIDLKSALGRDAFVVKIVAGGPGFVAVGHHSNRDQSAPRKVRPAVWTSADGLHWDEVDAQFPARRFHGFTDVVARGGVLLGQVTSGAIWRSTDATTWRKVANLGESNRAVSTEIAVGPRGFVAAVDTLFPSWSRDVAVSADGRHWRWINGSAGTEAHPMGLLPLAPLRSDWLAFGTVASSGNGPATAVVYRTRDGVHWNPVDGSDPPGFLGRPLASNRARTQVVGIRYPAANSDGGGIVSTRDARTWTELPSFHRAMPTGNPADVVASRKWWVVGGSNGTADGGRRGNMWASPDLQHWYEMPTRLLGATSQSAVANLSEHDGRVVGVSIGDGFDRSFIYVWTRPD